MEWIGLIGLAIIIGTILKFGFGITLISFLISIPIGGGLGAGGGFLLLRTLSQTGPCGAGCGWLVAPVLSAGAVVGTFIAVPITASLLKSKI